MFLSRIYNKILFSRTCICRDFKNMFPSYCRLSLMLSRNGVLNHILKRQTSRFHYGSKFPAVIITVLSQYLNKTGKTVVITTPTSEKWMSKTFLRHTLKTKYFWHFCFWPLIFIHFHYMKIHRLKSSLQRRNIFRQDLGIGIYTF